MFENLQGLVQLFPHAILTGVIVGPVCALLGVFTILKRVVFIGITLSEVAACGVACAMSYHFPPFVGAASLTLATVIVLSYPFETERIPRDVILGFIFVCASSLSILVVSKSGFGLHEVKALLYGDLILASARDIQIIISTHVPVLIYLLMFMRPTISTFLDREFSKLLGIAVLRWDLLYFLALGLVVSAASKVAGALLIFCFLVVAPAAALVLVRNLWWVLGIAALGALLPTFIGLYLSFTSDLPTNQTIAVVVCGWFAISLLSRGLQRMTLRTRKGGYRRGHALRKD